jgi:3-mercaptopyruvate sulfurtransferase SseA
VTETGPVREAHRLNEEAFLALMRRPGVVVLDARTESRYRRLRIAGAVNLPFTEFTAESLAAVIPSLDTPVLIYCNNNFADRLDAFPTKAITVSLNVSTYTSLRAYGYTRVYELGPLLKVASSKLPFAGESVAISVSSASEISTTKP